MQQKFKDHFTRNEIFYHGIRTAVVLIALLVLTLAMEVVSQ
ncbi:hypothetical protein [Erwinia typographi]|nr:hypothetical protein [Erwinia typographi]